ncbi:flagellar hook-length control protein FliK [Amphritea balenae]|uniref:Flagellar hook-length control protein FliK n=1 Tax=Amphritea balenae TaxID=452629 RepID=A0A3P1SPM0_9GAMM|nr:flagellar hook-length control protein FliK [Amphritea balenae]RRC99211.1 flagellar hook-length control protein FliK [Amphritea balenae]
MSAAELVRALPLNTPTPITVQQSTANPAQAQQFKLQVQLNSQLYQLNSNQPLPPGSSATLTRTAAGQLILSSATLATTQGNLQFQTINQPATTQTKPIQQSLATTQSGNSQTIAPDLKPIVQISGQRQQGQQSQGESLPRPAPVLASLAQRLPADLSRLLPVNRPVLANISMSASTNSQQNTAAASINGRSLTLNLSQPLPFDGKALLLRLPGGEIQIQAVTSPVQNQGLQQSINDALRYTLPTQQPVADSLVKLQQLNLSAGGEKSPINSILSSLINLFGVTPSNTPDSQASIRGNLLNGGLFTESKLASPQGSVSNELKQQLGQLLQQADRLPEQPRQQLQDLVKGLLNRVTSHQLESIQNTKVSSDGGIERFFALDLPIRHGQQLDNVELKISEHRQQLSEYEWQSLWKVRLHFDLDKQGTIDAELVLEQEHRITAHFWCSHSETATELNQQLPDFNQQLHKNGYFIDALNCSEGQAPKPANKVEQLIDVVT